MKKNIIIMLVSAVIPLMISCNDNNGDSEKTGISLSHADHTMPVDGGNYSDSVNAGLIHADTMKGSPTRTAMATINGTHVHIEYGSPGVKGRIIWGGLVAYDNVWATGAHNATSIQFSKPVIIDGKTIPKGTYGFFTIPQKDQWIVILNSRFEQHLADDYSQAEDLIRVSVQPTVCDMTQRLTYIVTSSGNDGGAIKMRWEKLEVALPFKTILP